MCKLLTVTKELLKRCQMDTTYNKLFADVKLVEATKGRLIVEATVQDKDCNWFGTLHGGWTASAVDVFTTMALVGMEKHPGVSVNLSVNYIRGAKLGETVLVDAKVLRAGKTLAYTVADIINKDSNELLAQGSHVKAFPPAELKWDKK